MHLLIDGYNLLHVGRSLIRMSALELERERDRLIERLAVYRRSKPCEMTVVFDGWQGGWITETKERRKGIELIFSKLGEKADEVIKRLVSERGAGMIVISSDRDVSGFAQKRGATVISSDQFKERLEMPVVKTEKGPEEYEEEEQRAKKKGPARRLSKKERRARGALKKL